MGLAVFENKLSTNDHTPEAIIHLKILAEVRRGDEADATRLYPA